MLQSHEILTVTETRDEPLHAYSRGVMFWHDDYILTISQPDFWLEREVIAG